MKNTIDVPENIIVPKAHDLKSAASEPLVAFGVVFDLLGMPATVDLDDQTALESLTRVVALAPEWAAAHHLLGQTSRRAAGAW